MENHTFEREFTSELPRQKAFSGQPAVNKALLLRPFWYSRRVFILLSAVSGVVLFVIIFALLFEYDNHNEDFAATWALGITVPVWIAAFAVREILVRRAKIKYLLAKERANYRTGNLPKKISKSTFSLEQNADKIKELHKLAERAESPEANAETHLAVVRACQSYLDLIEEHLPKVHSGSPRIAAFRAGQEKAKWFHQKHLLEWTAAESRSLTLEAATKATPDEKIAAAQKALTIIESALQVYPNETKLQDSANFVRELIVSTRVSHHIELAERAAFKKHWHKAIDHYQDAMFYLSRDYDNLSERESTALRIESEIEKLRDQVQKSRKIGKSGERRVEKEV